MIAPRGKKHTVMEGGYFSLLPQDVTWPAVPAAAVLPPQHGEGGDISDIPLCGGNPAPTAASVQETDCFDGENNDSEDAQLDGKPFQHNQGDESNASTECQ